MSHNPLSISTLGMLAPAGGGGSGAIYLQAGTDIAIEDAEDVLDFLVMPIDLDGVDDLTVSETENVSIEDAETVDE